MKRHDKRKSRTFLTQLLRGGRPSTVTRTFILHPAMNIQDSLGKPIDAFAFRTQRNMDLLVCIFVYSVALSSLRVWPFRQLKGVSFYTVRTLAVRWHVCTTSNVNIAGCSFPLAKVFFANREMTTPLLPLYLWSKSVSSRDLLRNFTVAKTVPKATDEKRGSR